MRYLTSGIVHFFLKLCDQDTSGACLTLHLMISLNFSDVFWLVSLALKWIVIQRESDQRTSCHGEINR